MNAPGTTPVPVPPRTLVVFSHLRWDFVFQRPQQLLSRLAGRWHVVYVEEPVFDPGAPRIEIRSLSEHLTRVVPHTPLTVPGFAPEQTALIEPMLARSCAAAGWRGAVAWLYTPMALPLLPACDPCCVVYDCMDEPSALGSSPAGVLKRREAELLERADLVLAAGPSLYAARREQHRNIHCLPSAVDAAHFAPARLAHDSVAAIEAAALQADLDGPRLGFFGVIDGRMDLPLVERLADAHPSWQLVMAGPVAGIDAVTLPRRPNIHWLGPQPYERLPHLLKDWDIALLPFVLNEATRFISPTKTLEYMAGETPVVSTAIADVVALYGDAVEVAHSHGEFIERCEQVLSESAAQRAEREVQMMSVVWTSSWQRTADCVHRLLCRAVEQAAVGREAAAAVP